MNPRLFTRSELKAALWAARSPEYTERLVGLAAGVVPVPEPQARGYLRARAEPLSLHGGMFTVTRPLHVFKQADSYQGQKVIVNLTIPKGATVFAPHPDSGVRSLLTLVSEQCYRKCRASEAVVHSIATLDGRCVSKAWSSWAGSGFVYRPGKRVTPTKPFAMHPVACASGIHFFFHLFDAFTY